MTAAEGGVRGALFGVEHGVTREQFLGLVDRRWQTLSLMVADSNGRPYVKPSSRQEPLPLAVIFRFAHVVTRAPDFNGQIGDWPVHKTEGYLWRNEVLYRFVGGTDLAIMESMRDLQQMLPGQIPSAPGFCGPSSFFAGGPSAESFEASYSIAGRQGLSLRVSSTTYPTPDALAGAVPSKTSAFPIADSEDFKLRKLGEAQREVAGTQGEEWIIGATEKRPGGKFRTTVTANWFSPGEVASSVKPATHLRLSASFETAMPPEPWGSIPASGPEGGVDQIAFFGYWNSLLASFRLRPGAV